MGTKPVGDTATFRGAAANGEYPYVYPVGWKAVGGIAALSKEEVNG